MPVQISRRQNWQDLNHEFENNCASFVQRKPNKIFHPVMARTYEVFGGILS